MRNFNLRRITHPDTFFGLVALFLLALVAGPNVLPRLTATIPFLDEGIACESLRAGNDRAHHQSLLSRRINQEADSPISLDVRTGRLPNLPTGSLMISIVIKNNTIAPVPLLIRPGALILDPNFPENGLGAVFNATGRVANIGTAIDSEYPEQQIRILGPRQICVHEVNVPFSQIPNASALVSSTSTVTVFYRNTNRGTIPLFDFNQPFTDQGLWVGVVESRARPINQPVTP